MRTFTDFVTVFTAAALLGFGGIYLAGQSGCTHQLTVEEADMGLTASCVLLSRAMTIDHPERLEAVLAQVCQPGRTREFISRVIARDPELSPREFLDLDFDVPPDSPPVVLPSDAGTTSAGRAP